MLKGNHSAVADECAESAALGHIIVTVIPVCALNKLCLFRIRNNFYTCDFCSGRSADKGNHTRAGNCNYRSGNISNQTFNSIHDISSVRFFIIITLTFVFVKSNSAEIEVGNKFLRRRSKLLNINIFKSKLFGMR